MNTPAIRTAWLFTWCNLPLGLAGAYGLLLLADMSFTEWQRGRIGSATTMFACTIPAALAGYLLWWFYLRCARRKLGAVGQCRLWLASTVFNALGIAFGVNHAWNGCLFPGYLWFVLATALSWRAWRRCLSTPPQNASPHPSG